MEAVGRPPIELRVAEAVEEAVPVPEAEAAAVEAAPMQVLAEAVAAEAVPMPTAEAVPMVVAEAAEVAAELRGLRRLRRGLVGRLGLWRLWWRELLGMDPLWLGLGLLIKAPPKAKISVSDFAVAASSGSAWL
jgi:hypothetical protein